MVDVTVTGCQLDASAFRYTRFTRVVFDDCRLRGADFTGADLSGVVFRGCDLTGVSLHQATMTGTRLSECTLEGVNGVAAMRGAVVSDADLPTLALSLAAACGITINTG